MNIHEYQAKALLSEYGVPVPKSMVAETPDEAVAAAQRLGGAVWVVKAQVHAGGRGKAGGVRVCTSIGEVEAGARDIIGMRLTNNQTGPEGRLVKKVLIEQGTDIARELYLAVVLDRSAGCLAIVASSEGGMDIEEVAAKHPNRIVTLRLGGDNRILPFQGRNLLIACGLPVKQAIAGAKIITSLIDLCVAKDAVQIEINPLAVDSSGSLLALDAKFNFDESALARHPDIAALRDDEEIDELEARAARLGVNYVRLDGYVGTMVNGAGLAMATMDAIKQAGAEPANFLDAGGGANVEMVKKGFAIILSDPKVRGILVNIFGGILRCDLVAEGIVQAVKETQLSVPLVVRMEGTNVEAGRRILAESGVDIVSANSMIEAATISAELTRGRAG